jgi:hypothetical protein
MKNEIKKAVESYQCAGCTNGHNTTCFTASDIHKGCGKHSPGTFMSGTGKLFLGMPVGFNRIGPQEKLPLEIFIVFNDVYDKFNIPTWKHLNSDGHTIVRGMQPRRNQTFLHVFLENCMDKIECREITEADMSEMD